MVDKERLFEEEDLKGRKVPWCETTCVDSAANVSSKSVGCRLCFYAQGPCGGRCT